MPSPTTMRALVHAGTPGPDGLRIDEVPRPEPGKDDVLIRVDAAGLNRHELFVIDAHAGDDDKIVGADAVGTITAVGVDAGQDLIGRRVLVNPCLGWPTAEDVPEVPTILGGPVQGTFAEFATVPVDNVHPIPDHLSDAEAAALPLAGLTAYRALVTKGRVMAGDHVVITGATGGAGTLALAMAAALGAETTVVTRHEAKVAPARTLGADHVVIGADDLDEKLHAPADLVLDSVGSDSFPSAVRAVRPGGGIISFGATSGPDIELSLRTLFFRQIRLEGTSMGSAAEFESMLRFAAEHTIKPAVHERRRLDEAPEVFRGMAAGHGVGKTVFLP
ncbi:zinc-binding alcohol dehydrogenase/oxidoreductase [Prauserella sediminis]|uniref:Zinc-binding alcohol dehydrogenase/oxidoreductase n=1 Tax=Prauserella sediminis TaxID=577680 RepID=A0A839XTZ5_9PSEU|nr:zinc-binding dehydrogenase [Prauserella sediminis]MBB3664508.1 zinc-binding alcohol dehydrogenase/oxidoreductase [Prauserella sediminis]